MLRFLLPALPLLLAIFALVDCAQTPPREVRRLPKVAWLAVIVLPLVGPVLWLLFGREHSALRDLVWPSSESGRAGPGPRRTVAPDDDPDFLRDLGHGPPRPRGHGRGTTSDEDAALEQWERELRRNAGDPRPGGRPDGGPEDDGPDGSEGSTDGAPRV
jgi:Phospholipase_D-nuclease N-terminal